MYFFLFGSNAEYIIRIDGKFSKFVGLKMCIASLRLALTNGSWLNVDKLKQNKTSESKSNK